MDSTTSHPGATLARQLLLAVLALLALLIAYDAARDLGQALRARLQWERQPAEVASMATAQQVELELAAGLLPRMGAVRQPDHATPPRQPGNVRVLLPQPPYALHDSSDPVEIAFDPAQPGRVHIIDIGADAIPPLVKLVWLLVLGAAAWLVLRAFDDVAFGAAGDGETAPFRPWRRCKSARYLRVPLWFAPCPDHKSIGFIRAIKHETLH